MLKFCKIWLLLCLIGSVGFSQQKTRLTVVCKNDFDTAGLKIIFSNGIKDENISINSMNRLLNLPYYGKFATVEITNEKMDATFIVGNAESQIMLTKNGATSLKNCSPTLDSINNPIYAEIIANTINERKELTVIFKQPKDANYNNRIQKAFRNAVSKYLIVISKYPENDFSYWFYKNQILIPSTVLLAKDEIYLKFLINNFNQLFKNKFTATKEHQFLLDQLNYITKSPIRIGQVFDFQLFDTDYNGNKLDKNAQLYFLDFWATWCPPCLRSNSFVEKIKRSFTNDELKIIKINTDNDKNAFLNYIQTDNTTFHVYDELKKIFFSVNSRSIPIFLLLNKQGEVLYTGYNELNTKSAAKFIQIIRMNLTKKYR